jgi:hypothetical protein
MRAPTNSSAELINTLEAQNSALTVKIIDAQRSYAEFIGRSQAEIEKNLEIIETLEPVATWVEVEDLPTDS